MSLLYSRCYSRKTNLNAVVAHIGYGIFPIVPRLLHILLTVLATSARVDGNLHFDNYTDLLDFRIIQIYVTSLIFTNQGK